MNLVEIEKIVGKIQNQLFKNSNSFSVGLFKSNFKGSGLQFREHQLYVPGDDTRFIDWKLSAKHVGKTYIKTFEEDRNIEIVFVIDFSESMFTGYKGISKLQASLEIACLLYLLTAETKDKVKVALFADELVELPARSGKEGIIMLIAQLEKMGVMSENGRLQRKDTSWEYSEKKKMNYLKSMVARNKEVLFFGELGDTEVWEDLKKLIYRRNFHYFKVLGPLDLAKEHPFSFWSKESNRKQFMYKAKSLVKEENIEFKKIKKIDVSKRYLEDFIKEMV